MLILLVSIRSLILAIQLVEVAGGCYLPQGSETPDQCKPCAAEDCPSRMPRILRNSIPESTICSFAVELKSGKRTNHSAVASCSSASSSSSASQLPKGPRKNRASPKKNRKGALGKRGLLMIWHRIHDVVLRWQLLGAKHIHGSQLARDRCKLLPMRRAGQIWNPQMGCPQWKPKTKTCALGLSFSESHTHIFGAEVQIKNVLPGHGRMSESPGFALSLPNKPWTSGYADPTYLQSGSSGLAAAKN